MSTLISEFQPNPDGGDPATVTIELSGTPGESFTGTLISIEDDGNVGTIDRLSVVSGTFDSSGLLTVTIDDLENPSFTFALLDGDLSGSLSTGTDLDADDDGVIDDTTVLGSVLDAIGIADDATETLYASQIGGIDFAFTGAEPELVFRAGSTGEFFAVNDFQTDSVVFDSTGDTIAASDFDTDPIVENTFGAINPTNAAPATFDLQITEIWPGNEPGSNLTSDWFEITNFGDAAWTAATDGALFFDDDSQDPLVADILSGIESIATGEAVVFVDDDTTDEFITVWGDAISLGQVGTYAGSGLSQGGDGVTLFLQTGDTGNLADDLTQVDFEAYPDAELTGGQSFDVTLAAFSTDADAMGDVDTDGVATSLVVNDADQPVVGSPTNGAVIQQDAPVAFTLSLLHFADQEANAATIGNIDNLSGVLNVLRDEDVGADGTLTLSSGDAIIPGLFFDASEAVFGSQGIADIQIQNELGVQAIALGNHEFDLGTALLAGLIDGSATGDFSAITSGTDIDGADFGGADFAYISANLDFSTDPNLAPLAVAGGQAPQANTVTSSVILDAGGETIGVVGATVPTIRSISSPGADLGIEPAWASGTPTEEELDALAAIIQFEVDALLAANPDMNKVILASHMQQISIELALAERLTDVDIIIAGGSNTRLFDDNDRIRDGDSDQGEYPQFVTNAGGTTTAVVNTDGNYKYVGRLVIDFDEDGNLLADSYDADISGAFATDDQGVADLGAENLIDAEIDAITDAIQAEIVATESNVFGVSDVFLNGNRSGTFAADDPDGVRTQETNLGNLTADANLEYAQSFDSTVVVSIKNGGGIRANIGQIVVPAGGDEALRVPNEEILDADGNVVKPEGGISQNDIATTLAFNNGLALLDITKAELKSFLEGAVAALPTGVSGGFPQISGLKFSFDETQTAQTYNSDGTIAVAGERVQNAAIFDADDNVIAEIVRDGEVVGDATESFRIVTLNFLANAGDEILSTLSNPNRVDLIDLDADGNDDESFTGAATFAQDGSEQDALAEYLNDNFNPDNGGVAFAEADTGPALDERIQNLSFRGDAIFPEESAFTLSLLHFTDQEANAATIDNIDNLSGVLNALRDEDVGADGTLTLSAGDAIIPGLFFDASAAVFGSEGVADIQIQNELGVQAIALGNHEFDLGTALLAGLIDGSAVGEFSGDDFVGTDLEGAIFDGTAFPYLSTNLDFSTDANLAPLAVAGGQAPQGNVVTSSVVADAGGEPIGIVGATTPTLARISSPGDLAILPAEFDSNPTDEQLDALAAEIQFEVDALLAANPDMNKVVLLSHMQQLSIELALAERLEGVDIIVAGGSNTRLFDDNDRARDGDSDQGQYPQFVTNAGGTTTAVVNTDGTYKYVGRLVLDFDEDGNVLADSYDEVVSGAFATDDQGVADLNAEALIDAEVDAITDAIQAEIVATESNVFGVSDVFLNGNRSGTFTADDPDGVRTQETNLGNLTADANLAYAKDFDPTVVVSIKNGGGIRANIGEIIVPAGGTEAVRLPNSAVVDGNGVEVKPEGGISQNDIATTLAFNNGLTLLDVTKAELVAVLEGGVSALDSAGQTGVSGGFPQVAGVKFSFDETQPAGERIVNAGIFDGDTLLAELVRDGEIVGDASEVFRIVTLNFLANGGDGVLGALSNPNRVDLIDLDADGVDDELFTGAATFAEDGSEQDALAEFLNDNFNPSAGGVAFDEADTGPALDERIQNLTFRADTILPEEVVDPAFTVEILSTTGLAGAEIVAFDPDTNRAFVTSGDGLQVIDASNPSEPVVLTTLAPEDLGFDSSDITSVAVANGIVAVARPDATVTDDGQVLFYDAATLAFLGLVAVGPLPDMLTFNEDGTILLVANEGQSAGEENEPDILPNPDGSVSIITIDANSPSLSQVTTLGFEDASITFEALAAKGVRVNTNAPSAAADLEPEYITIEGNKAFIALQENNAVAVIDDITNPSAFTIDDILSLGTQDHSVVPLDASDRDGVINRDTYPIVGLRQPDGLDSYEVDGVTYFFTANEGDGRDVDESRGADLVDGDLSNGEVDADIGAELIAQLGDDNLLGRLKFSNVDGDTDGDGDIDVLHSFGSRSFTIFDEDGNVVFDSADDFEAITEDLIPDAFNSNGGLASDFDERSDDKGPEPEAVELGTIGDEIFAFVGLERVGGIMVYNVTDPLNVAFDQYIRNEDENGDLIDLEPEGLEFIAAADSPTGRPLLAVTSEDSNTLTFHEFTPVDGDTGIAIGIIQGAGHVSSFVDQEVTTSGIVTAVDFNGYYLQDEGDGDDATSDAIFVFVGNGNAGGIAVGDEVAVTGTVSEFIPGGAGTGNLSITQITDIGAELSTVLSQGNTLPAATILGAAGRVPPADVVISADELPVNLQNEPGTFNPDVDGIDFYESLEGMLVTIDDPVVIAPTNRFDETWVLADNGAGATPGLNDRGGLNINADIDGLGDLNPERIQIQYDAFFDLLPDGFTPPDLTLGDDLSDVTGVFSYSFGNFEVLVTDEFEVETRSTLEAETTDLVGTSNELTVATYNVLNLTSTLAVEDGVTDPDAAQRALIADQIVNNLNAPDIIALQEIQDNDGVEGGDNTVGFTDASQTLQDLVDSIAAAGGPTYSFAFAEGVVGTQGGVPSGNIRNAFLFNEDRVQSLGVATMEVGLLSAFGVSEPETFVDTRDPLLGTFLFEGERVSLINNHFSSRFGSEPVFGGPQPFNQGGEAAREAEAKAINELVDSILRFSPEEKIVVLGDLNTFEFTDELSEDLPGVGDERVLTNLIDKVEGDDAYSFIFQGNSQALDHIFVTDNLLDVASVDYVHVNNDFPVFGSDHEPVVAKFSFPGEPIVGTDGNDVLTGTEASDIIDGLDGSDQMFGLGGADTFVVSTAPDGDDIRDFQVGVDKVDVSNWGTQLFDDLQFLVRGSNVLVRDVNTGDQARLIIAEGDLTQLGEESFVFADISDEVVTITGTGGNDVLVGGAEENVMDGGLGSDIYLGGSSSDIFVFGDDRRDVVGDFEDGLDLLDVSAWGVTSFDQLIFTDRSSDRVFIGDDAGNSAIVRNIEEPISSADLDETDFIFSDALV